MKLLRKLEYSPSKRDAVRTSIIGRPLMNKILRLTQTNGNCSYWSNSAYQSEGLVWLQAAQPEFFDIFQKMILYLQ
jgi:hypothetical protein